MVRKATRKKYWRQLKAKKNAEAAQWCYDYAEDGVTQGEAFLLSKAELEKLYVNKEAINKSLRILNATELRGWTWSLYRGL